MRGRISAARPGVVWIGGPDARALDYEVDVVGPGWTLTVEHAQAHGLKIGEAVLVQQDSSGRVLIVPESVEAKAPVPDPVEAKSPPA